MSLGSLGHLNALWMLTHGKGIEQRSHFPKHRNLKLLRKTGFCSSCGHSTRFLTLEADTQWKGLNVSVCRRTGFDDLTKRRLAFSDSVTCAVWNRTHHFTLMWPLGLQHLRKFTPHQAGKLTPSAGLYFKVFELDLLQQWLFFFSHINDEQLQICPHLDALIISNTLKFLQSLYCSEKLQVEERLPLGCFFVSQL